MSLLCPDVKLSDLGAACICQVLEKAFDDEDIKTAYGAAHPRYCSQEEFKALLGDSRKAQQDQFQRQVSLAECFV